MATPGLNHLQLRIVAALQVDGRASWRKIAEALGEPERTVARHGSDLLESGRVVVAAVTHYEHQMILACESTAGTALISSEALAQRADVTFCYLTTGRAEVVAEIGYHENLRELLTLQLPATAGLRSFAAFPVLKYFKTIRGWRSGALTAAEEQTLLARTGNDRTEWTIPESRGPKDGEILRALQEDGRVSIEALARRAKMSETSVARRIEWLLGSGQCSIRALVEPALVGYPVESMLWVQVPPHRVEALGHELGTWPEVRYAAAITGDYQLVLNLTATTHAELYALLAHPIWSSDVTHLRTDLIVEARKRGGRLLSRS
ncbi:Lrp/AsnC family transcriptional regulator [Leucobacter chromiireducens]|uniref:Lrp/AsnC family transcriptional regulator n=1 Tax=Leucobacter chromiireducens TaxID=283877 RepID=UPI000F63F06E|nr:Lrp/AsnC family transcriptional regulator [Leucobacter chromiireducens]